MIQEKALAKLDLNIHILPKKVNDLFTVKYLDCQINLYDNLSLEKQEKNEVICKNNTDLNNEKNFVFKVLTFLNGLDYKNNGVKVTIDKNIPIKAGFGGGSSDAAAGLKGVQKLWQFDLKKEKIIALSKRLGKDFFYSYFGGLSEVTGKGKEYGLKKMSSKLPTFWLIIVVPMREKPSTGWMYQNLDIQTIGRNLDKLEKLKEAIKNRDRKEILNNLFNDFEGLAIKTFPVVADIKNNLIKAGADVTLMAGAGLSVVGFFNSKEIAKNALDKMKLKYKKIILTKTI